MHCCYSVDFVVFSPFSYLVLFQHGLLIPMALWMYLFFSPIWRISLSFYCRVRDPLPFSVSLTNKYDLFGVLYPSHSSLWSLFIIVSLSLQVCYSSSPLSSCSDIPDTQFSFCSILYLRFSTDIKLWLAIIIFNFRLCFHQY